MKRAIRLFLTQLLAVAAIGVPAVGLQATQASAAAARIVIGAGTGTCPAGYACFWEAANFQGRGVAFYNAEPNFSSLPSSYRFINDTSSSVFNNGTSGMQIRMCEHPNGAGRCITLARGWTFPDLSHSSLNMNDTISSLAWFWA